MTGVPGYWASETSGVLQPVVRKYLTGAELTPPEIAIMRAYLCQWVNAAGFLGPDVARLRRTVEQLGTTVDVHRWLDEALDAGIDPL